MSRPNILIILADDIGVDVFRVDKVNKQVVAHVEGKLDSAGPVRLPTFERMLTNGVHFEKAWSHPVCTPTRASLWTGVQPWKMPGFGYPSTNGDEFIPDKTVTGSPIQSLAQAIKAQSNYRCAMFGKWDLGSTKNPVQMGWDYFAGIFGGGLRGVGLNEYGLTNQLRVGYARLRDATVTTSSKPELCTQIAAHLASKYDETFLNSNPDFRYYIWQKDVVESNGTVTKQSAKVRQNPYATADQVADAKQWIAAQEGTPWCVALNLITPHDPFHLPPPRTYRADTVKNPANPSVQEMLVAMMESMDYYVGDLLQAIDSQLSNTVVIFVGDNGTQEVDADTGGKSIDKVDGDDKGTAAIGGVHVPMIIADGGRMKGGTPCYTTTAPRSIPEPVHSIDIYRTALDIAGVTPTVANDSISIAPYLTDASGIKRTNNFSQMYYAPELDKDGVTARTPGIGASAGDGTYKLSCSALLDTTTRNSFLIDELGNKVQKPDYRYQFSRLEPDPDILGSFVEKKLDVIKKLDGAFAITDLAYFAKIMELYATLIHERLDSNQTCFPAIVAGTIQMDTKGSFAQGDYMHPGELLNPDQAITSANGRYSFIYQGDGNLVLYDGARPLWASNTYGSSIGICIMQADGNLVIYDATVQAIWSSDTWQHPGSQLVVQDDGNVVIYQSGGIPVWATNTSQ